MLKKIFAVVAALCVITTLGACESTEQTNAETTAAATTAQKRETETTTTAKATTTAAVTTTAETTTAEPEPEETEPEETEPANDTAYYEELAASVDLPLNTSFDVFGNSNYGYTAFYDDGTVDLELVSEEFYEEGTWTVEDGEVIINLPSVGELPVEVIGYGDAILIGDSDAVLAVQSEYENPSETLALLSDSRGTYMDVITMDEELPGIIYWIDLDDDGNTIGEGEGTYDAIEYEGRAYLVFAIDDITYNDGEKPLIVEFDDFVYTNGAYIWERQDLEDYEYYE